MTMPGLKARASYCQMPGTLLAVDADAAVLVALGLVGVILILPEAAAEDSRLVGVHHAATQPSCASPPATTGVPSGQTGFGRSAPTLATTVPHSKSSGRYPSSGRWKRRSCRPSRARFQVENARRAGVGRLGEDCTGHLANEPVVEHGAHGGSLFVRLPAFCFLTPEQAGQSTQRVGLGRTRG